MTNTPDHSNQPIPNWLIEVSRLQKSPHNVRKTASASADEELKASIHAHGLMQNLVVTEGKKGKYLVIAGARRLEALKSLQVEGKLPDDYAVPCQLVTEANAAEMSLAENTVRQAMHPADEFEAFTALVEKGQSPDVIATNFGTTAKHVLQRLKLGRVAPELLAEYRAEEIDLDCLMAFSITDDHKRQLAVYKSLQGWQKGNARHIRGCLTDQMTLGADKLAKFVGINAYEAAGGKVRADLFGEEIYLENTPLLNRLAAEKLETEAEKLRQEGWGWVEIGELDYSAKSRYGRIEAVPVDAPAELIADLKEAEAEQSRIAGLIDAAYEADEEDDALIEKLEAESSAIDEKLEGISERLESYVDFNPEEMKVAGCLVYIGHTGTLEIDNGLVKPQDKKAAAKAKGIEAGQTAAEKPKGISESLRRDLEVYRLSVAQVEIAKHPAIAFDLMVFKVASNILTMRSPSDGPAVSFNREFAHNAGKEARGLLKAQMEPVAEGLPKAWLQAGSEADQFLVFQQLSDYQKQAILAYCVAMTLQPKLDTGGRPTAYDVALAQTGASMADYWRPTTENFLSRITKDQLLEIGSRLVGGLKGKQWATSNAGEKKGDIAAELHRVFNTDELPGMTPEQVERVKNWLPDGMAFREAPEPTPTKAKKGKKAA